MYWINLYKDIKLWRKFAKTAKSCRKKLEEHNLRVDNIGRIYTVINLPDEIVQGNEYMHEAYVLKNLGPYNKAMEEIGLAGYAYPEMSRIEEPGSAAYLLVLYPETPTIGFWRIIGNLFLWSAGFIILRILYRIVNKLVDFSSLWESFLSLIF
jgi:hypothetical protein